MEPQTVINFFAAVAAGLLGWVMRRMREDSRTQSAAHTELSARVRLLELEVAGQVPTREEFDRHIQRIFEKLDANADKTDAKLDAISAKMDRKVDR